MDWHRLQREDVLRHFASSFDGLSGSEAQRRRAEYGPNLLAEARARTPVQIFLAQFADFMIVVLLVATVVAAAIGEWVDAAVIAAIVTLNAVLGFVQEYRAANALAALRRLAAPTATAVRNGAPVTLPAAELVPGDIVRLEAGMIVPADLRLLEAIHLTIEEAALTGESQGVEKQCAALAQAAVPLGERSNLAFRGTVVSRGRGLGVVVATGMATELGRIATLLRQSSPPPTPLQKRLTRFGRHLSLIILAICATVFLLGLARGEDLLLIFLTAVSLAVAAIPEALPAVVTMALAFGAAKLVRTNTLVRKLPAVETLGSVTYICSDKTGTLTLNRMTVDQCRSAGDEAGLMRALALCNDAISAGSEITGEATETALYRHALAAGFRRETLEQTLPRCAELPFEAERKAMTTCHRRADGGILALTKGAPEIILARSVTTAGEPFPPAEWLALAEHMADAGLRTLAFAERAWHELPAPLDATTVENGLTFLGLVGLLDPPRPEAAAAVASCRSAGIVPVMITGDHPLTACAIARRLDLLRPGDEVLSGSELLQLDDRQLSARVARVRVYARIAPEEKLRIVRALQDHGEFVAMTGDGINDAPALQCADIGLAMGQGGTDVAREAAHMVLLDDNFATIVTAIREGRRIYDNIRKFTRYLLTTNAGEIMTIAIAPLLGLPLPLLPIHILWINLMTDALPALALSCEPGESNLMRRPPRPPRESLFAHGLGWHAVWVGSLIGALVIATQAGAIALGDRHWQTLTFCVLCFTQLFHVLAIRSETESLLTLGLWSNRPLLGAVALSFVLQLTVVYLPACNPIFRTVPLTVGELTAALLLSSLVLFAVEAEKFWRRQHQPARVRQT